MENFYGCLADISKDLVCKAVNQLRYPCCFNHFVGELEKEEDNLVAIRNSVEDRVANAKKQTRKTAEVVDNWLEDAKIHIDNVNQLLEKARKNKSCCFGHCPNWICRYLLGKKLANKKRDLEKSIQEGTQYIQLERIATLPSDILDILSEKCLNFESRQPAYEQVMEALKDDKVAMIGLYGMGGCGKTTLAMEVRKKAEAERLFDKVLFVPVSSTVEVRRIQEKIASSMQYTFPENEEMERAQRLCMRLTQEKKILIILDDVWEKLDFGAIGIPSSEHHKGCKILITTRSEAVCTSMDCQRKIHLPILTDEEAWALFQKKALISEGTPETLKHLARLISNECKGLPVVVAAVTSSLKGKPEVIWSAALNKLRSSKQIDIERGLTDPYKCLQLSYNYLDSEEAKSLFLLCSVFPEDYEVPIELLTRCAIGLGVVGEVRSYGNARSEVIAAKIKLIRSCLLLDADDKHVKMHDFVRDVAHSIAKNEKKDIKCELEKDVTLEQNSIRYLWCVKFPNDLDCSNLEFLHIAATELEELDGIFKRMGKLKVLYLINDKGIPPLSTMSFKTLTNLRCLILRGWKLSDISFIRDMKKLQSLSLHYCSWPSFFELQTDAVVTQLTNLKFLELNQCYMERKNFDLIKRIPLLEELYIIDSQGQWWDAHDENTIEFFNTFSVPQTLQRYGIVLRSMYFQEYYLRERFFFQHRTLLMLPYFDTSNEVIKDLAKKAKELFLANIQGGAKSIIPDIFQMEGGGMNELNVLEIRSSDEIECLVDTSNHLSEVGTLFSKLVTLTIHNMDHLRALWHGFLPANGIFEKLEKLWLGDCPRLTSLFTYVIAPSAHQDQKEEPDEIIEEDEHQHFFNPHFESNELNIFPESTSVPSAPVVNHISGSFILSRLKSLKLISCPKLMSLFMASTAKTLTSLENLVIEDCHGLTYVWMASKNSFTLQYLKTLEIGGCEKLEVIFPLSVLRCLPELEILEITECKELKQIMEEDVEDKKLSNIVSTEPSFPKLKEVVVEQCHKLKRFFSGFPSNDLPNLERLSIDGAAELEEIIGCGQEASKNSFCFRNLKSLKIKGCAKLEVIFPQHVLRCLPELERLEIRECKKLKQIMEDKKLSNPISTQPCFPKLASFVVEQCHKLKCFFSVSASNDVPNLELLIINGAAELEEIIGCEQGKCDDIGKVKVELPKLKLLIFMHLPNLLQGTELLAVKHRIVRNCPKLFLTSTTTLQELWENNPYRDFENTRFFRRNLNFIIGQIYEDSTGSGTSELAQLPSSQINEKSDKEIIGKVPGSELLATAISTKSEQNDRPSPNPLDISQHETHSQELVDGQSTSVSYLTDQQKPLGETESTIGIPRKIKRGVEEGTASENAMVVTVSTHLESTSSQSGSLVTSQHKSHARQEWDSMPENTSPLQKNQEDPATSKSEPSSSQVNDNMTENNEEIRKESIQKGPPSEGATVKTLSAGVGSISLGNGVATHRESRDIDILAQDFQVGEKDDKLNEGKTGIMTCQEIQIQEGLNLMDKQEGIGIVSNNNIEVSQASADTRTRLRAYKHFVDLDDAQIALLAEAIAAYPHLWNACEKFSERFQALMLKTLAEILFFLRNETAISITPQRENEFHRLCDVAVQLGFERSWVDEMRRRVVVRDPELDHAQARIEELLKRRNHLTRELRDIQNELKILNDFVDAQTKCFDFL